jgi:hypothetical protein
MVERSLPAEARRPRYSILSLFLADGIPLLLIAAAALFVASVNLHISYDDAFITYRYAYNFAAGAGFVYNRGEWFLGTTAPLYGLILGLLGMLFGPDAIPTISGYLSGIALLLAGVALYVYGRLHSQPLCGLLAGLFFVSSRLLPLTFGGEMLFQVALLSWCFVVYRLGSSAGAAVLLALAILTRLDSAIAAGAIGMHYLLVRRRLPGREMLYVGGILLPFALLAWAFYGSLLPATLDAKLAQRDSGLWPSFAWGLVEWLRAFTMQSSSALFPGIIAAPHAIRYILFVALGLPALLLFRFWALPLAWVALFILAYSVLNVPFYGWYVVPVVFGLAVLAGSGVAGAIELSVRLYQRIRGPDHLRWARIGLSAICLLVLAPGILAQLEQTRMWAEANPIERLYEKTGVWLDSNTPPEASVGYLEIGRVGYYARRTMIDPLGLIDPSIAPHVARGELLWAYERYRPGYIIYNEQFAGWLAALPRQPWFQQEYHRVARLDERDQRTQSVYSLDIYMRTIAKP